MLVQGPFYTIKDAASYCGYKPRTFTAVLRDFDVPRHGPRKNRLAKSVLDAWMASPESFRKQERPRSRKPKPVKV